MLPFDFIITTRGLDQFEYDFLTVVSLPVPVFRFQLGLYLRTPENNDTAVASLDARLFLYDQEWDYRDVSKIRVVLGEPVLVLA